MNEIKVNKVKKLVNFCRNDVIMIDVNGQAKWNGDNLSRKLQTMLSVTYNNFECLSYDYLLCFKVSVTAFLLFAAFVIWNIRDNSALV